MPAKSLTISALVFSALICICCNCKWFETIAALQELFEDSDVVVVGLPIKNVDVSPVEDDAKRVGYHVLFKVISSQKGAAAGDTLFILQGDDNCARRFRQADTIMLFGSSIKRVRKAKRNTEYLSFDTGNTFYVSRLSKSFRLYKHLGQAHSSVFTSQCIAFPLRAHSPAAAFLRTRSQQADPAK
jgi:hypothetical protein